MMMLTVRAGYSELVLGPAGQQTGPTLANHAGSNAMINERLPNDSYKGDASDGFCVLETHLWL